MKKTLRFGGGIRAALPSMEVSLDAVMSKVTPVRNYYIQPGW